MNESYFESIFAIFDEKSPFLSILDTFEAIFGRFSYWKLDQYQWFPDYWIELCFELNQQNFLELNNILNWILGTAILSRILNEWFFLQNSNIELNQIGYRPPLTYPHQTPIYLGGAPGALVASTNELLATGKFDNDLMSS